jgi:hypothetical protein
MYCRTSFEEQVARLVHNTAFAATRPRPQRSPGRTATEMAGEGGGVEPGRMRKALDIFASW